jgi:hypothetical protein
MVVAESSDSRVVNDQREMDGRSRFVQYQVSHKTVERIVVGRRHAGIDGSDGDCLRFVVSLDLWEQLCRPKKVMQSLPLYDQCPSFVWCFQVVPVCSFSSRMKVKTGVEQP